MGMCPSSCIPNQMKASSSAQTLREAFIRLQIITCYFDRCNTAHTMPTSGDRLNPDLPRIKGARFNRGQLSRESSNDIAPPRLSLAPDFIAAGPD
jgi:hypothetical protein